MGASQACGESRQYCAACPGEGENQNGPAGINMAPASARCTETMDTPAEDAVELPDWAVSRFGRRNGGAALSSGSVGEGVPIKTESSMGPGLVCPGTTCDPCGLERGGSGEIRSSGAALADGEVLTPVRGAPVHLAAEAAKAAKEAAADATGAASVNGSPWQPSKEPPSNGGYLEESPAAQGLESSATEDAKVLEIPAMKTQVSFDKNDVVIEFDPNVIAEGQEEELEEEEIVYDNARENRRAALCGLFVACAWAAYMGILSVMQVGFENERTEVCSTVKSEIAQIAACESCGSVTTILPIFGEYEQSWPKPMRAALYLLLILWTFVGISIICDQFMAAIEQITASERIQWLEVHRGARQKLRIKIWNPTVANLTLMALGSSAPEILLSIVEIYLADFYAGELGPSTIVGSAAFNLFVITAVCVSSIPPPEVKRIACIEVFMVTSAFSILAYLWMFFMLRVSTPERVDVTEGLITFFMFPVMLCISYTADKGWFSRCRGPSELFSRVGSRPDSRIVRSRTWIEKQTEVMNKQYGKVLPWEVTRRLLEMKTRDEDASNLKRSDIRKAVTSSATGGHVHVSKEESSASKVRSGGSKEPNGCLISFEREEVVALECAGVVTMKVVATSVPASGVQCRYRTIDGTAAQGVRYQPSEGVLKFSKAQPEAEVAITVIDDAQWEPDEFFEVELVDLQFNGGDGSQAPSVGIQKAKVIVLNDDVPGTLEFDAPEVWIAAGTQGTLGVCRTNGNAGRVSCSWRMDAVPAVGSPVRLDFETTSGELVFEDKAMHQTLVVDVPRTPGLSKELEYRVSLFHGSSGVEIGLMQRQISPRSTTGVEPGPGSCKVWICPQDAFSQKASVLASREEALKDMMLWSSQFTSAVLCNGSKALQSQASAVDWFMHCICLPWKLIFAFVPPSEMCNGWLCFTIALMMIGGVTVLVGDTANQLGCCLGITNDITAITLVALGTSLPDTFASRIAAQQDDTADNSVGNVTGSNSVNVFLGLGISWMVAAFYWELAGPTEEWKNHLYKGQMYRDTYMKDYPTGGFIVPSGSLGFSVTVYTCCALVCIALLMYRRNAYGGELGGPKDVQRRDSIFLVCLWLVYCGASIAMSVSSSAE